MPWSRTPFDLFDGRVLATRAHPDLLLELLVFTYPFWIFRQQAVQSWKYAVGNLSCRAPPQHPARSADYLPWPTRGDIGICGSHCRGIDASGRVLSVAVSAVAPAGEICHASRLNQDVVAPELLIVGNRSGTNVGGAFERAAATVGVGVGLIETNRAMQGAVWRRRACWWLLGRRPSNLARFSNEVVSWCKLNKPTLLLACGIAPMSSSALRRIGDLGVRRINYLTDDPWNPAR